MGDGLQHWCRACFRAYFKQRGVRHLAQVAGSRRARAAAEDARARARPVRDPLLQLPSPCNRGTAEVRPRGTVYSLRRSPRSSVGLERRAFNPRDAGSNPAGGIEMAQTIWSAIAL